MKGFTIWGGVWCFGLRSFSFVLRDVRLFCKIQVLFLRGHLLLIQEMVEYQGVVIVFCFSCSHTFNSLLAGSREPQYCRYEIPGLYATSVGPQAFAGLARGCVAVFGTGIWGRRFALLLLGASLLALLFLGSWFWSWL